jgi:hypothetical protein
MDRIQELRNSLPRKERRFVPGAAELRAGGADKPAKIGMTIPFGTRSADMGFTEIIDPGAFDKTLADGSDVACLWNHDTNWPLGRTGNRALVLTKAKDALDGECTLNPSNKTAIESFLPMVQRGDVAGSSFGFETVRDSWEYGPDGDDVTRTLLEVRLLDVSPVTFPAYPDSEAESRAVREERATLLAAVRGVDLVELRAIIAAAENGHALAKHEASLRRLVGVLTGMLPAPAVPIALRRRQLDLRARVLHLEARKVVDSAWSKPTLSDFTDKAWGDLTAAEKKKIGSHFAWAPADAATFGDLKLPYKEPNGDINLNAVRNALSRLPQTEGIPEDEKAKIKAKLEKILEDNKAAA